MEKVERVARAIAKALVGDESHFRAYHTAAIAALAAADAPNDLDRDLDDFDRMIANSRE